MLSVEKSQDGQAVCSWSPVRSHCPVSVVLNHGCSEAATGFSLPGHSQRTPFKGCGGFLVKNRGSVATTSRHTQSQPFTLLPPSLSTSCLFLCLPLTPFFLASFFRTYVFIGIQTISNPRSVFPFYFSCLCVWCAHMYMCIHMHMHVCVCACMGMCVHVYTCRVQKLALDVFLMYPPSHSCGRFSHSNPEHTHTALTSLVSQLLPGPLCLCLWCGSWQDPDFSLHSCTVGVFAH